MIQSFLKRVTVSESVSYTCNCLFQKQSLSSKQIVYTTVHVIKNNAFSSHPFDFAITLQPPPEKPPQNNNISLYTVKLSFCSFWVSKICHFSRVKLSRCVVFRKKAKFSMELWAADHAKGFCTHTSGSDFFAKHAQTHEVFGRSICI